MLDQLSGRLEPLGVILSVTAQAEEALAKAGFDPDYGARPLRRAIRAQVEDPAAELLLSGALPPGSTLTVEEAEGAVRLTPSPAPLPAG